MISRELALRAAYLLEREAAALRECHTVRGEWFSADPVDVSANADYDEMMATAAELRRCAT